MKKFVVISVSITLSLFIFTPIPCMAGITSYGYYGGGKSIIQKSINHHSRDPLSTKNIKELLKQWEHPKPIINCDYTSRDNNYSQPDFSELSEKHEKKFIEAPENFEDLTGN